MKRDHIRPPIHHHATSPQERTTPRRYLNCRGAVMAKQPKPQARPSHRAQPVENKGVSRKPCWMHSQSDFRGPGSPFRPPTFRRFSFSAPKTPALRHPITSNRDSLGFPRIRPFSLIPHPRPTIRFAMNPSLTRTSWIWLDLVGFTWIRPSPPKPHGSCHPLTHSPTHPLSHSPIHPFTDSPIHPFTHSPIHPFTHSPIHLVTLSPCHWINLD